MRKRERLGIPTPILPDRGEKQGSNVAEKESSVAEGAKKETVFNSSVKSEAHLLKYRKEAGSVPLTRKWGGGGKKGPLYLHFFKKSFSSTPGREDRSRFGPAKRKNCF